MRCLGGLSLSGFLRMAAAGDVKEAKAKSAIFINLQGGPSHMDTFDLKPDSPSEYRGQFNPIKTNVEGVEISEHLPNLAKCADKYAILRGVTHTLGAHQLGTEYVNSGNRPIPSLEYPGYGAVVTKEMGAPKDLPPFVAIMANGTSGDINNINFRNPRKGKKPYEQMRYVAYDVADKVQGALGSLDYKQDVSLAANYREPVLKWRHPTDKQRKWAEETIAAGKKSDRDLSYIYAERAMRQAAHPETTTVPLQVLRIGDVTIGTMPCEVFAEIGMALGASRPITSSICCLTRSGSAAGRSTLLRIGTISWSLSSA